MNIAQLLREGMPATGEMELDFSEYSFDGFTLEQPARFCWQAVPYGGYVRLSFTLGCTINAVCVRCLAGFTCSLQLENQYDITLQELSTEYPEYPVDKKRNLDLQELAYGEIVMGAPMVPVCHQACQGLCAACGALKGQCACQA